MQVAKAPGYTRIHKPQKVAYVELFNSRVKAMKHERAIKKMTHQQKLNLINSRNAPE
jgi:predicted GIY-YIG superfamily endonuclease